MWKNRLCYLALLACTGLFFICYDGYLSLYVFSLSLLLPFVSLAVSLPGMLGARAVLSAGGAGASGVPCARRGIFSPCGCGCGMSPPFPAAASGCGCRWRTP